MVCVSYLHSNTCPRLLTHPLTESSVSIASAVPFRMADEMVSALTAGVLSTSTVYRLLRDVGHRAIDDEPSRWEACFERGEDVCDGQQQTDVLYTEADGVWGHLQREEQPHYEVKSGIAYRGWRNVGDDRYELVGKRVYGHASEQMPFWKGGVLSVVSSTLWRESSSSWWAETAPIGYTREARRWVTPYSIWTASISLARVAEAMADGSELLSTMAYV